MSHTLGTEYQAKGLKITISRHQGRDFLVATISIHIHSHIFPSLKIEKDLHVLNLKVLKFQNLSTGFHGADNFASLSENIPKRTIDTGI